MERQTRGSVCVARQAEEARGVIGFLSPLALHSSRLLFCSAACVAASTSSTVNGSMLIRSQPSCRSAPIEVVVSVPCLYVATVTSDAFIRSVVDFLVRVDGYVCRWDALVPECSAVFSFDICRRSSGDEER